MCRKGNESRFGQLKFSFWLCDRQPSNCGETADLRMQELSFPSGAPLAERAAESWFDAV